MTDTTLLLVLDEIRHKTLSLLDGLTDEQARRAPRGLHNTILWHAGHAYVVVEWLTMEALGAQPSCPDGWFEMFSWSSRPAEVDPGRWPALADVVHQLRLQHGRMRKILRDLCEERLCSPAMNRPEQTLRYRIFHALHDEAGHGGEIWLLRKMLTATRP